MVILKPVCGIVLCGTQVRSPLGCSDCVAMSQMDMLKQFRRQLNEAEACTRAAVALSQTCARVACTRHVVQERWRQTQRSKRTV